MWGAPEEPPDELEGCGPSEQAVSDTPVGVKEICEDNKSQLETFKDIMLKNKSDLKKKEEELQEYASKLSEIKSRAKRSRRSKDAAATPTEMIPRSRGEGGLPEVDEDVVDDISQAKTPKAKSSLLQRKLAENRKIFERRSKEMTESKRAVEEKVEAIRQQMDQTDLTMVEAQKDPLAVTPVRPVLVAPQLISPPVLYVGQDKDNKIAELSNRILELEATLIDLQENLREKDSVIDSKTKAVTLMSADLSKKGKTTLDTLEDTKDEMRTMQENFILIETSLRGKNENLLEQLHERNDRVTELEETITRYEQEMEEKRAAETASASFSRSTMDTLADTKDAMRSMQENFVLIETSLKDKIENLLGQLQDRETKLAEAVEKIYKLESGAGIVSPPEIPDLQYKIDRLEQSNRALQDEKYELQKSIADLQEKIVARESSNGNGLIVEKDNRIAELENLIEELKSSNQLLEEESKAELQKQVVDLATKNEEFGSKIDELERLNNDLEIERNELRARLPDESGATREDAIVRKLTKELDDLNKSMIKLKAQHKGKLRNLQKQLESFKMVSDANAELVKLGNQVALLEEEKGNLQLSLVDFDELKASAGDWQDRIADLESRVSTQTNDIQSHIEAIAILENQKLDLMQELHTARQEISALEAENAESENLRVTAEMKVVDLEEQLESSNRSTIAIESSQSLAESEREVLLRKIDNLTSENSELMQKVAKLEEKPSSEAGSTESFETIHEDRNEMSRKIEALSSRNNELEEKLSKLEEAARSNVGSTESFETINDTDKTELVKKIDLLSRENSDLLAKLNKYEEKGSSDTGSTESFEKIPERSENSSRLEFLTRENNELVIKLTKLEEKLENMDSRPALTVEQSSEETSEMEKKLQSLARENNDLAIELTKAKEKLSLVEDEKELLSRRLEDSEKAKELEINRQEEIKSRLEALTSENNDLIIKLVKLEEKNSKLTESTQKLSEAEVACEKIRLEESEVQSSTIVTVASLEREIEECRKLIAEQTNLIDEMKIKLAEKEAELETRIVRMNEYEASAVSADELRRELKESSTVVEEWKFKCSEMERKMEILEAGKLSIEEGLKLLQEDNRSLVEQSRQKDETVNALKQELDVTITTFENQLESERALMVKQEEEIDSLREILKGKEEELHEKYSMLQNEMIKIDSLQEELNDCRTKLHQSEETIVSLNEEILKLNDLADNSRQEIAVLREELLTKAEKEESNEELRRSLSDKETLVEELRVMLNERIAENEEIRSSTEKLEIEVEKLRALLIERENEVASIAESKLIIEENLRESDLARNDLEIRLESLQNNYDENSRYTDGLRAELSDAYRMLELLKAKHTEDIEMQNRRLEDLLEELNSKTSELKILRSELIEKTNIVRELEGKTSELEILRSELMEKTNISRELEEKTSELEILRAELSEKIDLIRELRVKSSEFDALQARVAEQEKLVGENVTEEMKIALERRVAELEEKLEESSASTQAQLQKRKILAANLKKKSSEAAELEARAVKSELRVAELEAKIDESETRISQLETKSVESEARAELFEEKWTSEKSEKEAANLRIQEIENVVQNRDDAIMQLEAQLQRSRSETASATSRVDELSRELENSSEKMNTLMEQVTEMGEEIEKLRMALDVGSSELESARLERERLIAERESSILKIAEEENQRQQVLEEAKEKARELGVRMQVMESEYVEQLNTIQTLRTENGMLLSKQAQINERLENTEKESADRKVLLEEFQRESAARETESLRRREARGEEDGPEVDGKAPSSQPCDQCGQCETVVQALEAKLQERDAEIENLDNELANSIGNFVHMRESLRVSDLINQFGARNRSLEESRENSDLVFQYNTLTASNAEIRDQLNSTVQENQELKDKIASIQALNAALEERIGAVEEELIESRETTTRLHAVDALRTELAEKCELRENELSDARGELEVLKLRHEQWMVDARSKIEALENGNVELTKKCDGLVEALSVAESEVVTLRNEVDSCRERIRESETEVEEYRLENARLVGENSRRLETPVTSSSFFEKKDESGLENARSLGENSRQPETPVTSSKLFEEKLDDGPRLFDAARLFGLPMVAPGSDERKELDELRNILAEKDREILELTKDMQRTMETQSRNSENLEIAEANRRRLEDELAQVERTLSEKNRQVDSLSAELNNVGARLSAQFDQRQVSSEALESTIATMRLERDELAVRLNDAAAAVENLTSLNARLTEDLEKVQRENHQLAETLDLVSSAVRNLGELDENVLSMSRESALPTVGKRRAEIFEAIAELRNERNDFAAFQDACKRRISTLERELENSCDQTRVQELEERVDAILRERDIKQLQVNDLTRSLEEMQESMEKASSNEIKLRNLQAALDKTLSEHDALKLRLETLTSERDEKIVDIAETESAQAHREARESEASRTDGESGWDDEPRLEVDEDIWSWNPEDAESHANIPAPSLIQNPEIALNARIAELEDTIRDLETERDALNEEAKNSQSRNAKLLKKLKEFKIQNESLQQQLKIQKASGGFCDLDSAIEEELKSQITRLEKSLNESRDENKKITAERENLSKRIEVLSAANERLVEMKERQDMEVEVLQIRTRDLSSKLQALEWRLKESCGEEAEIRAAPIVEGPNESRHLETVQAFQASPPAAECLCKKYREDIDELRDEMEALAAENEQLQKLLEEQKNTRLSTESKLSNELQDRAREVQDSALRISELQKHLDDSVKNCRSLEMAREELAAVNADQQTSVKQIREALNLEIEKASMLETEVGNMRRQISDHVREREELIERARSHDEAREKLSTLTEAMAEVTDLLNSRVQEVAELRQEMQKLRADRNEALDTVEGLSQRHSRELSERQLEAELHSRHCEAQLLERDSALRELAEKLSQAEAERATWVVRSDDLRDEIDRLNNALAESRSHRESLQSELASKEQELFRNEDQVRSYAAEIERLNEVVSHMRKSSSDIVEEANKKIREFEEREAILERTISELKFRESVVRAHMSREISEKELHLAAFQQTVTRFEKIHETASGRARASDVETTESVDVLPVCKMIVDDSQETRDTLDRLRAELARKNEEIEDYRYQLSESTYPSIIQALQDQVNTLYEEKAQLEESLVSLKESLAVEEGRKVELAELLGQQNLHRDELENQVDELRKIVEEYETRDTEIRRLTVEVGESEARFRDARERLESLEAEINEMRIKLSEKDEEIGMLRRKLESTSEECELLRRATKTVVQGVPEEVALRRDVAAVATSTTADDRKIDQSSNELDLALYMLHQRDVRCEELTHELMQLLEERDTLQLRLSNAIRINEELRRTLPTDAQPGESLQGVTDPEPLVEQPSPSRSVGPVEIAKEAIDSPSEEKVALAEKLSQLHNMGHRRDVRLMDDRDMRHNQQMSLLAHRDVLSTLPPEAAARLVNANYTLSRDVQSQSSVLMNWLWGKSTPKVVHM